MRKNLNDLTQFSKNFLFITVNLARQNMTWKYHLRPLFSFPQLIFRFVKRKHKKQNKFSKLHIYLKQKNLCSVKFGVVHEYSFPILLSYLFRPSKLDTCYDILSTIRNR